MEYLVLAGVIILIVLFVFIKGSYDEKQKEKKFIKDLYENYGQFPQKKYEAAQYNSIRKYFENHKKDFVIDDITWNDLEMDAVFMQMNHTYSSAGEEYLYYTLRTPFMEEEPLKKREKRVRYFMENEDDRVKLQVLFSKIGKTGKFSIYDYLDFLDSVENISNASHFIWDAAVVIAILLIFWNTFTGIFLLIGVLCYNITTYFRYKSKVDPYITSFGYVMRMIRMGEKIVQSDITVIEEEREELKRLIEQFQKFRKGSRWLMSPTRMSGSMDPLSIVGDYLRMMFHIDLIQFNKMIKELREHKSDVDAIVTIAGSIETAIAVGAYRVSFGEYCIPVFDKGIALTEGYHPLIKNPVKNSILPQKGVLLTGSNASGKSTFLKTVAINAILAQTIHTCLAQKYTGEFFRIYTSMSLRDDLGSGESYYMVEIKSLKRIIDAGDKGRRILCFVDEVLRGTNTVERIAASTQILRSFSKKNTLCFAATHDIELTSLLTNDYENYHFEEEVVEGDVLFNYEIKEGKARTRNAIKLLSVMGYDEEIIRKANEMAEKFINNGVWA
ncbi:MAG: hypothetical protein K2K54_02370 [Lachnospiraceae bacterium]|nr:hypothetical protein [Lachnospiraceae bacterium]